MSSMYSSSSESVCSSSDSTRLIHRKSGFEVHVAHNAVRMVVPTVAPLRTLCLHDPQFSYERAVYARTLVTEQVLETLLRHLILGGA